MLAGSAVGVFASATQAQASWNRVVRPRMLGGITSLLRRGAAGSGSKLDVRSQGPLPVSLRAPRTAPYRIVADITAGGRRVRDYLDVILLGRGAVDVALVANSLPEPMPPALEGSLARKVASRLPAG